MTDNILKQPPHSIEAEQALIGGVLANGEALAEIDLMTEDFYRREHRVIWGALLDLQGRGDAIDPVTLGDVLARDGQIAEAGGIEYLVDLVTNHPSAANLRQYAQIVADRAALRRMIQAAHRIADLGFNPEGRAAQELLSEAAGLLTDLDRGGAGGEPEHFDKTFRAAVSELERRMSRKGELLGTPAGWRDIDARLHGLMPGNLIVIAARPSMGKSVFGQNIAEHVALQGKLAITYNLEMSTEEMMFRLIASQGRIPLDRVQTADLQGDQWDRLSGLGARFKGKPLFLSDNPGLTSAQVLSHTRRIARRLRMEPGVVVIDYLQLLGDKGDSANERAAKISRNLKLAAKSLKCPIIALCQLNRGVEQRSDKRPIMSDLRDSGAIEQDADVIGMLYRDEVYHANTQASGILEVIWRKVRNGVIGTDFLAANLSCCRFDNLAHGFSPRRDRGEPREEAFAYE